MARVLSKRTASAAEQQNAVYIGRPSKWGNPFSHLDGTLAQFKVASREEAIRRYELWLGTQPLDPRELAGRDLLCWCAPEACHGDVLLRLANKE